jgi:hypothetical protein
VSNDKISMKDERTEPWIDLRVELNELATDAGAGHASWSRACAKAEELCDVLEKHVQVQSERIAELEALVLRMVEVSQLEYCQTTDLNDPFRRRVHECDASHVHFFFDRDGCEYWEARCAEHAEPGDVRFR